MPTPVHATDAAASGSRCIARRKPEKARQRNDGQRRRTDARAAQRKLKKGCRPGGREPTGAQQQQQARAERKRLSP
ncbi:hypothetical protein [Solimonas flava]|uniref:hypothetical protein n=1 Tax=Solimonas flava TaxID=415849 RepID=UPI0012B5CCBA|nr:hypothetical protein [Solimonas flava]